MAMNDLLVRNHLRDFAFGPLFWEELGWDRYPTPLTVQVDGKSYRLTPVAEKRGMVAYVCAGQEHGELPDYRTRRRIEHGVTKATREHLVIYTDSGKTTQVWQWVKREAGKPAACREHTYHQGQTGEALVQKLRTVAFSLDEEEELTLVRVTGRARAAFDIERVTKRFYERFKTEHAAFLGFIQGIENLADREWYASVMLNRLMFIYFIQKKRFLDDDPDYLQNRLLRVQRERGKDQFHTFYRRFLLRLCHKGLGTRLQDRSADLDALLGKVPYLNGGLFMPHPIEERSPDIQIADEAFEQVFRFFNQYQWHLDERPLRRDNEINPDVLGFIFEKYINQKQMGAYYTKEDITEYITRSTVVPYLLDATQSDCLTAFQGDCSAWRLLQRDPDRYLFAAVKHGTEHALPAEIAAGVSDVAMRGGWNRPAPADFALPTETWRELVARRQRCEEIRRKMAAGEVETVNELITLNLDIRQFAQDVIETSEAPALVWAFWKALETARILDPTVGSGAFLFAALNILEPLYEACLERMEAFVTEADDWAGPGAPERHADFRALLARIGMHPNRRYYILKSIMVNNLFGVDIMEEATEICKLRLFLKLVAQVEKVTDIEPLPDVDFNIRAGNTLVGYVRIEDIDALWQSVEGPMAARSGKLAFEKDHSRLRMVVQEYGRAVRSFRNQQLGLPPGTRELTKRQVTEAAQDALPEINKDLWRLYRTDGKDGKVADGTPQYQFESSHEPFHWFLEFPEAVADGGFDVIIGNPPYVNLAGFNQYQVIGYDTRPTNNLYALVLERSGNLISPEGRQGFIVPVSSVATEGYLTLQSALASRVLIYSSYDDRPAHLFDGLDKNTLSILLLGARTASHCRYSTRLRRWNAAERSTLFERLEYVKTPECDIEGCLPKIGSSIEQSIWTKLFQRDTSLSRLYVRDPNNTLYYSRKINSFLQILDFVPEVRDGNGRLRPPSEFKKLAFRDGFVASAVYCCLSSTLFRWFVEVVADGSHLNRREIDNFPFDPLRDHEVLRPCAQLAEELSACLGATSEVRVMRYGHDTLTVQCIIPKNSKPILDKIDRLLARHYGLTNEEADYIINYDVKFRLGRGAGM